MNDRTLIERVRQHVILYDITDPRYTDPITKNEVWEKIGAELNTDGTACKNRWYNIRDTYRKSLKRVVTKSGPGGKVRKQYKYANQLSFLKKYLSEEKEIVTDNSTQDEPHRHVEPECILQNPIHEETDDPVKESSIQYSPPAAKESSSTIRKFSSAKSEAKKSYPVGESASSRLIEYLIERRSQAEEDPVDVFLKAMSQTLKGLSEYDWHQAKAEIFNTVQKYELRRIKRSYSSLESCATSQSPGLSTSVKEMSSVDTDEHIPPHMESIIKVEPTMILENSNNDC